MRTVTHGDVRKLQLPPVDTVLMMMMMNGIGLVGTLDGLDQFLPKAAELLNPRGQVLVDSGQAHQLARHRCGSWIPVAASNK